MKSMRIWKLFLISALFLTCTILSTSFSSEGSKPTKTLVIKPYQPYLMKWDETKFVQDENGSAKEVGGKSTEGLNDPIRVPNGLAYGVPLDSLNGVYVYHNSGKGKRGKRRHRAEDGYNLGLKWQCVEFVKRYYYQYYNHKMPKDRGHAKSFYKKSLKDGEFNKDRGLFQYSAYSDYKPEVGEIIVFKNKGKYGHVAIISSVKEDYIEIIEQNSPMTRREYLLHKTADGKWWVENRNGNEFVLGRLGIK